MQQVHHDGKVGTAGQSQKVNNDKRSPEKTSLLQLKPEALLMRGLVPLNSNLSIRCQNLVVHKRLFIFVPVISGCDIRCARDRGYSLPGVVALRSGILSWKLHPVLTSHKPLITISNEKHTEVSSSPEFECEDVAQSRGEVTDAVLDLLSAPGHIPGLQPGHVIPGVSVQMAGVVLEVHLGH